MTNRRWIYQTKQKDHEIRPVTAIFVFVKADHRSHVIGSLPYDYTDYPPARDKYVKDQESWFEKVKNMARNEGIAELKTETFPYATSIIGAIVESAANKDIVMRSRVTVILILLLQMRAIELTAFSQLSLLGLPIIDMG
jgi:hypothetical protein